MIDYDRIARCRDESELLREKSSQLLSVSADLRTFSLQWRSLSLDIRMQLFALNRFPEDKVENAVATPNEGHHL